MEGEHLQEMEGAVRRDGSGVGKGKSELMSFGCQGRWQQSHQDTAGEAELKLG